MSNLLSNLSALTSLEHLEIDKLSIAARLDLTFKTLKRLAIDLIEVTGQTETAAAERVQKLLRIRAANLETVDLGEWISMNRRTPL